MITLREALQELLPNAGVARCEHCGDAIDVERYGKRVYDDFDVSGHFHCLDCDRAGACDPFGPDTDPPDTWV